MQVENLLYVTLDHTIGLFWRLTVQDREIRNSVGLEGGRFNTNSFLMKDFLAAFNVIFNPVDE